MPRARPPRATFSNKKLTKETVILVQPKCVLMRAKRGERAACARTGYPAFSPPGGLSSRTHAELQLHCGRNGLLAVGFSSGSSALKICSILSI
jgi:hypothetical protein